MKLLFCPNCYDLFKLDYKLRSCSCGLCKGKYRLDGGYAVVNGKGLSIALASPDLEEAVKYQKPNHKYRTIPIRCWARPHSGEFNTRTEIDENL